MAFSVPGRLVASILALLAAFFIGSVFGASPALAHVLNPPPQTVTAICENGVVTMTVSIALTNTLSASTPTAIPSEATATPAEIATDAATVTETPSAVETQTVTPEGTEATEAVEGRTPSPTATETPTPLEVPSETPSPMATETAASEQTATAAGEEGVIDPTPSGTATPSEAATPTETPTETPTAIWTPTVTRTPTRTPTPFLVSLSRNSRQTPVPASQFCAWDGEWQRCNQQSTSLWSGPLNGSSRWGSSIVAPPEMVVLGITPVPGGGTGSINGRSAQYEWPAWTTGRRDVRFVVATVTPGPITATPLPTPTATPTAVYGIWTAPPQPNYSSQGTTYTSTQFIEQLWEPLRLAHPDYISREVVGQDATGEYDIYSYTFAPPTYERTVLVTASLHGSEIMSQLATYRLLWHVTHDADSHPALTYLRHNVRFVVIPIASPWATNVSPRLRRNVNGVDLNRNFDYLWHHYYATDPALMDYKGAHPFSEVESRLVRDWLERYRDADVYFDIHNSDHTTADYQVFLPLYEPTDRIPLWRVMQALRQEGESVQINQNAAPMAMTYAAARHQMLTLTPEFPSGAYGVHKFDSTEMQRAVTWYGNLIVQYATWNQGR